MVGRELRKLRPSGEDHRGLVWGRPRNEMVGVRVGRIIDVLKN